MVIGVVDVVMIAPSVIVQLLPVNGILAASETPDRLIKLPVKSSAIDPVTMMSSRFVKTGRLIGHWYMCQPHSFMYQVPSMKSEILPNELPLPPRATLPPELAGALPLSAVVVVVVVVVFVVVFVVVVIPVFVRVMPVVELPVAMPLVTLGTATIALPPPLMPTEVWDAGCV